MPISRAQQIEQLALLAVVGTGRIAERGPDAAVALRHELLVRQRCVPRIPTRPRLLVEMLGERLGEAIGERLHHDRAVVVVLGLEPLDQIVGAEPGRHGERAEVVGQADLERRDVVGERRFGRSSPLAVCWRSIGNTTPLPSTMSSPSACAGQNP